MQEPPASSPPERTVVLLRRAQSGDREALDELFGRYLPVVRHIVAARMGLRLRAFVDHEDLVQETLLRAIRSLETFDHKSEGSFRDWLAVLVENEIRSTERRRTAKKRGEGKVRRFGDLGTDGLSSWLFVDHRDSPSAVLRGAELEERIEEALLALPAHHRELIVLRKLCGMSYEEIAETMGSVRIDNIRRGVSRALVALEKALEAASR